MTSGSVDRGELLSAYLDGELRGHEIDEVSRVLSTSEDAIAEFRGLQQTRRLVRRLPELEMPVWLLHDGHSAVRLSAYLDGELNADENHEVVAHVMACRECRHDLQEFDRARTAIRALPGVDAPPGLIPAAVPPTGRRGGRRRVGTAAALTLGAAAALAVLFGLYRDPAPQPVLSIEDLGNYHVARASAEPAFSVLPAVLERPAP
jgi:anti-sigma factor RsiW